MGRTFICAKTGLRRGAWSQEEDRILKDFVSTYGHCNWRQLPKHAGLLRCGKSCRLRWLNYLRPNIKRGNYTKEEDELIIKLQEKYGNKWSMIAARLPGRTDNGIKNHWHSHLEKHIKKNIMLQEVESKALICEALKKKEPVVPIQSTHPNSTDNLLSASSHIALTSPSLITDNQATGDNIVISPGTVLEFDQEIWNNPFLLDDAYIWKDSTSTLVDPFLAFPFSNSPKGSLTF